MNFVCVLFPHWWISYGMPYDYELFVAAKTTEELNISKGEVAFANISKLAGIDDIST